MSDDALIPMGPPPSDPNRIWSPQQEAVFTAVRDGQGHLLVRARAGTGKTSTLVEALRRLPSGHGLQILVCAFNRSIADELRGKVSRGIKVRTLHAFGFETLKRHWGEGLEVDKGISRNRLKATLAERGLRKASGPLLTALLKIVAACKARLAVQPADIRVAEGLLSLVDLFQVPPDWTEEGKVAAEALRAHERVVRECERTHRPPPARGPDLEAQIQQRKQAEHTLLVDLIQETMRRACRRSPVVDYDDMIFVPAITRSMPVETFDQVLIDETQDMNPGQLALAQRAAGSTGRIIAIGDDRQGIYGWNGADVDFMDRMLDTLSAKEEKLTVTFRCPQAVVALAQRVVPDLEAPPTAIVGAISRSVANRAPWKIGDVVLSRFNVSLVQWALHSVRRGIPVRLEGSELLEDLRSFVEQIGATSVRDLLLKTEEQVVAVGKLLQTLEADEDANDDQIHAATAAFEKLAERRDVLEVLGNGLASVKALLDRLRDLTETRGPVVLFSSTHRAKGREWDHVWLLASTYKPEKDQEEENLWYVALTRAKKALFLVEDPEWKWRVKSPLVLRALDAATEEV